MEAMVWGIQWNSGRTVPKNSEFYGYYDTQKRAHEVEKDLMRMHRSIKFKVVPLRVVSAREDDHGRFMVRLHRDVEAGFDRERRVECYGRSAE